MVDAGFLFSLAVLVVLAVGLFVAVWRTQQRLAQERREKDEQEAARVAQRPAPSPDGKFTAFDLWPRAKYRVVTAFVDFDNVTHPVGERWTFLRKAFLPYEAGLSLFVEENGREVHIRMQSRDDTQGHIVRAFSEYVVEE